MERAGISGLYVIIDPAACRGRTTLDVARLALEGGARIIQWRDKQHEARQQLELAQPIRDACVEHQAVFVMNDRLDLALALEADAVHLGPDDMPVDVARRIVDAWRGRDDRGAAGRMLVGASTNNVDEARRAEAAGADYIAVGAIFPTTTKAVTRPADVERLREVKSAVHVPVVAIGGITIANIDAVIDAGADAAAVITAVCAADDPRAAASELSSRFDARR